MKFKHIKKLYDFQNLIKTTNFLNFKISIFKFKIVKNLETYFNCITSILIMYCNINFF